MDGIIIDNGDSFEVATDPDGNRVVKIENRAWMEDPRYVHVTVAGKGDRRRALDEFIAALEQLRDAPESHDSGADRG